MVRRAAAVLLLVAAIVQIARVSVFMRDPTARDFVAVPSPWFAFYTAHSCFSPYMVAAAMSRQNVHNVYLMDPLEAELEVAGCVSPVWVGEGFASKLRCADRSFGGLDLEPYEYPPPFLLLPRAGLAATDDFFTLRTVWYAIDVLGFIAALLLAAWFIGGRLGRTIAWLAPAVVLSLPVLLTLQIGNFQLAAFAWVMIAMIAFERGHHAAGGALLAFVTLSKIYPGIMLVVLILRRQWRALAWTAAAAAALFAISLLVLGPAPLRAFLGFQLPNVESGEAFPWLEHLTKPESIMRFAAINFSPYGIVKKLGALGVPGMTRDVARALLWLYGVGVLALAAVAGHRLRGASDRWRLAVTWLALLSLASLRSPFAPNCYAGIGTLWLLTLLLARRAAPALVAAFLLLAVVISEGRGDFPDTRVALAFDSLQQLAVFAVNGWALWLTARRAPGDGAPRARSAAAT